MDVRITYTKFPSLYVTSGERVDSTWDEFKSILREPEETSETVAEYRSMSDRDRTRAKDVGGYVGGILERNSRERDTKVLCRYLLVIDADKATMDDADDFSALRDEMFFCHTTHTSTDEAPRLRWVLPLSRPVSSSEYVYLVSLVQKWINGTGDTGDDSTDEPKRLMFWPSHCSDSTYRYWEGGTVVMNPDLYVDEADSPNAAPELSPDEPNKPEPEKPKAEELHIPSGSRNNALASHAGLLRNSGMDFDGIYYALSDYNTRYCDEPLSETEVLNICRSICQYKPGDLVDFRLRDAEYDFSDLVTFEKAKPKEKKLTLESMAHLAERYIPEPKWIVKDLITTGITILASPPKFGKSWMVLDMCQAVGLGEPFLGLETTKADVLYFALEDSDYRLKDRQRKVAGNTRKFPENVFFVKDSLTLKDGLLEYLKGTLQEDNNIGLVVIDTLQKIRGVAGKTEGVYGFDYREVGDIQGFAMKHNLAIVLVHHTNKGQSTGDPVEKINGSTGLSGAADAYMILEKEKRRDEDTKLHITGRDVEQRTVIIRFNKETYRWEYFGEEKDVEQQNREAEFRNNPVTRYIVDKLDFLDEINMDEGEAGQDVEIKETLKELADEINKEYADTITSSVSLGRFLNTNETTFKSLFGITISKERSEKSRTVTISRPSVG